MKESTFEERRGARQSICSSVTETLRSQGKISSYYCSKCGARHKRGTKVFDKHFNHHGMLVIG